MSEKKTEPITLLSPEATGGDIATTGFAFQDDVLIAKLPRFLAEDGFTAIIRESIFDFEASFFSFPGGTRREGYEAKDYSLTPGQFWAEVDTFARVDASAPTAYGGFTLVSTGLSDKVEAVANGLRRVRDPYPFYAAGSGILEASYAEYERRVRDHEKSEAIAQLLFDKVRVEPHWNATHLDAESLFIGAMAEHHPWSRDCRGSELRLCYSKLKSLIQGRKNRPLYRHELEDVFTATLPPGTVPASPLRMHTAASAGEHPPAGAIVANWEIFFGGSGRSYPPPEEWGRSVLRPLEEVRQWAVAAKRPRRLLLSGNRRLSTSIAIGWVFSAVSGFAVVMEACGSVWATDAHASENTPPYPITTRYRPGGGDELVVTIGILRNVGSDVSQYAKVVGLDANPRLDLSSDQPVVSPEQLNLAVRSMKDEIGAALGKCSGKKIHLFVAGPAQLALLLGHRMNALASMQCYEWVQTGQYAPTCLLGTQA